MADTGDTAGDGGPGAPRAGAETWQASGASGPRTTDRPRRRSLGRFWGRSAVVTNQGSAARDHLANERTFLAWVRTALGIIGLGVVVTKLVARDHLFAETAGLTFIILGVAGIAYALERYRKVSNHLAAGQFPVARLGPLALAGVVLLVALVAVFLVLR